MPQRIKFAGPFVNRVTFDKNEIRKKIIIPTYNQARRYTNIYKTLVQEFREEGCLTSAKYFQILIDKEQKLYETASIRDRISDEPALLLGVFDNCKIAEKAALLKHCNGTIVCARLLLQCILLFEPYESKFNWIIMDVMQIITKICKKVCEPKYASKESLCQIYYKFGLFLSKSDLEQAVSLLETSCDLAKGTNWANPEQGVDDKVGYFSLIIAKRFAEALLKYGCQIFRNNPGKAIQMANKAVIVINQAGIENNKILYIQAYLNMAEFEIEASNFDVSLTILEHIIETITPNLKHNDPAILKCLARYYHLKGSCLERLKRYDLALKILKKALELIRKLNEKQSEGEVLIEIAKVYMALGRSQNRMAKEHFQLAKNIFVKNNDIFNIKKTSYQMANLKVHNIQPIILDLIKNSPYIYCDKHRLRYWKYACVPFWRDLQLQLEQEEQEPLKCLLKATEMKQKKKTIQLLQRLPH